jgi:hypothetical protein
MAKQKKTIQRELAKLVELRLYQLGYESLFDFMQHSGRAELFDDPLCPLVNPACPDDLCYLPAGHIGTEEGYHITGTVAYSDAVKFEGFDMAEVGTSRHDLVDKGRHLASILFPGD